VKGRFFVFDVESVGLHGEGFAVAGGLYSGIDDQSGNVISDWEFTYACPPEMAEGNKEGREWIKKNVPELEFTHACPTKMRGAFWNQWLRARELDAPMVADCLWPVEARFLLQCVHDSPDERAWKGPYTFHEVGTLRLATGVTDSTGEMASPDRLPDELPIHSPLADARFSARQWFSLPS